jgi:RNA 3'-terminal phosphate cyclase (ATP)
MGQQHESSGGTVEIDGARGEGGGQIVRSSLTLSALTGRPVRIERIRAGRRRPGLLRQHLTAVRALTEITGAAVEGDTLGSDALSFQPATLRGGDYRFAVGTAGSACLVAQTVLPALCVADEPSTVVFEGGTHNPSAPPWDFLEHIWLPAWRSAGVRVDASLDRCGFYPAGGGSFRVRIEPAPTLRPFNRLTRDAEAPPEAWAWSSQIPKHVATRELSIVREGLGMERWACRARDAESPGPGNAVSIHFPGETPELVTAFGAVGRRAEAVAEDALEQARAWLDGGHPVGEMLADQLVMLVAVVGGAFRTGALSSHATTHVEVARQFLGADGVEVDVAGTTTTVRVPRGLRG